MSGNSLSIHRHHFPEGSHMKKELLKVNSDWKMRSPWQIGNKGHGQHLYSLGPCLALQDLDYRRRGREEPLPHQVWKKRTAWECWQIHETKNWLRVPSLRAGESFSYRSLPAPGTLNQSRNCDMPSSKPGPEMWAGEKESSCGSVWGAEVWSSVLFHPPHLEAALWHS